MATPQTVGNYLLQQQLPPDLWDGTPLDKKTQEKIFTTLANKYPEKYVDITHKYMQEAADAVTRYGRQASIGLNDLELKPAARKLKEKIATDIRIISQNPKLTGKEKSEKIVELMRSRMDDIKKTTVDEAVASGSGLALSAARGFRSNPMQLTQILFGDVLLADHKDRAIPIPGMHGYGEGVRPEEYWAGSYGSRTGHFAVQFNTAHAGFLAKQLKYASQRQVVTGEDCGAVNTGLRVSGDDPGNIGSVLAKTVNGIPAGTVLTKEHVAQLEGTKIRVRSLLTCQQPDGICKKCAGLREQGRFPETGSYVGLNSASVVSEPMTQQLALSAKHVGGVAGRAKKITGLPEVQQMFNLPERFVGAAPVSPVDGTVTNVIKAPQGGYYTFIGDQKVYSEEDFPPIVTKGQTVEAGDSLTEGIAHPSEIAKYKGLGAGRAYWSTQLGNILADNGIPAHRKHIESLSRAMFDRVRITSPEGLNGYVMDDLVPYTVLSRDYLPRKGSVVVTPKKATGAYLEEPVLHYTIGTRVTPSVIKDLEEDGVSDVKVHKDPPPFEPEVVRVMDVPATDPDWKVRLAGFGLRRSLLKGVTEGAESSTESTTYVPKLMDPSKL